MSKTNVVKGYGRALRRGLFRLGRAAGGFEVLLRSQWRRTRLLILCYHGVSVADEHLWRPDLYISPESLKERLAAIRRYGIEVVSLSEGLDRLRRREPYPPAVAVTFDDGFHDFFVAGYPLLVDYNIPATLYLSTWYVDRPFPVFDLMVSYLLWRGLHGTVHIPGHWTTESVRVDTRREVEDMAAAIVSKIRATTANHVQRQEYLGLLAGANGIDLPALMGKKVLHFMSSAELRMLDPSLVNIQLHTHRHRLHGARDQMLAEIAENRSAIASVLGDDAFRTHFCYPNGQVEAGSLEVLRESGITCATTCVPGLAGHRDNPLLLPRVVDGEARSLLEFEAWLVGMAELIHKPFRRFRVGEV